MSEAPSPTSSTRRRRAASPVLSGAGIALVAWLAGVHPVDALLIGGLVTLALAVPARIGPPDTTPWRRGLPAGHGTGWAEPAHLSHVLVQGREDRDLFVTKVLPRARGLADARLERLGLAWDHPHTREVLGPDIHPALSDRSTTITPADPVAWLAEVLDRLDRLESTDLHHDRPRAADSRRSPDA